MVVSRAICVIDGLKAYEDHCMPMGPTVFNLDSQIPSAVVRSRAAATSFPTSVWVSVFGCAAFFYKLGQSYLIHLLPYSVRNHGWRHRGE